MKCPKCGFVVKLTGEYVNTSPRIVWTKCSNSGCNWLKAFWETEIKIIGEKNEKKNHASRNKVDC